MQAGNNPKPRNKPLILKPVIYPLGTSFVLPQPQQLPTVSFLKVISERKSLRTFCRMSLKELSTLLAYTAKVKAVKVLESGSILSKRYSASAGGIHPIDLLFSFPESLAKRQLYYYNPFFHQYALLNLDVTVVSDFFCHVNRCLSISEGTLIWMLADLNRTKKYYANPESLVWRDAGVLLNAIQLTATAINLNSCPIGTLAEPFIQRLFGQREQVISAGGIIVGKSLKAD